jgi:hypothetical protein
MLGRPEEALRMLLASRNPVDDEPHQRFKDEVLRDWGDWRACRDAAGRFGEHHSVFEHLAKAPHDFSGAFTRVATRLRLIHLYAWQSHLWNRAVSERMRTLLALPERVLLDCVEGVLVTWAGAPPAEVTKRPRFALAGERLAGVEDPLELAAYRSVLEREGMRPEELAVEPAVPGFVLKAEARGLVVRPRHLRVRPPEPDALRRGAMQVRVRFELPRGSYASLVVKRLLARPHGQEEPPQEAGSRPLARRGRQPGRGERRRGADLAGDSGDRAKGRRQDFERDRLPRGGAGGGRRERDAGERGQEHPWPSVRERRYDHGRGDRREQHSERKREHRRGRFKRGGSKRGQARGGGHDVARGQGQGYGRPSGPGGDGGHGGRGPRRGQWRGPHDARDTRRPER